MFNTRFWYYTILSKNSLKYLKVKPTESERLRCILDPTEKVDQMWILNSLQQEIVRALKLLTKVIQRNQNNNMNLFNIYLPRSLMSGQISRIFFKKKSFNMMKKTTTETQGNKTKTENCVKQDIGAKSYCKQHFWT